MKLSSFAICGECYLCGKRSGILYFYGPGYKFIVSSCLLHAMKETDQIILSKDEVEAIGILGS